MNKNLNHGFKSLVVFCSLCFLFVCFLFALSKTTHAEEIGFVEVESPSGLFEIVIPSEHNLETRTFRIDRDKLVVAENLISRQDQRPYKNAVKTYLLKVEQTLGPSFTEEEIDRYLQADLDNYVSHYRKKDALVLNKNLKQTSSDKYGELQFSYEDPQMGNQSVQIRIVYEGNTKYQLIAAGPQYVIGSRHTQTFFDSFDYNSGLIKTDNVSFFDDWRAVISPMESFTAYFPEKTPPYVTSDPELFFSDQEEKVSFVFNDPVRNQKIFYNIYGYRLPELATFRDAEEILLNKHVARYRESPRGLNFQRILDEEFPAITTSFPVRPTSKNFGVNTVMIRVFFSGNYVVIQEVMASYVLSVSDLVKNLWGAIKFHPELAEKLYYRKQAEEDKAGNKGGNQE